MSQVTWEDALRSGDLSGALAAIKESVRAKPTDGDLRLVLMHLAALSGEWESAVKQLKLYGDLGTDEQRQLLVITVTSLVEAETQRVAVLAGEREPLIFGDPLPWMADLIQMHRHLRAGETEAALQCRDKVTDAAESVPGTIDGKRFAWLGDTDSRFPAIFEAVIGGSYYWLPVQRLLGVRVSTPKTLRDLIWLPVNFQFTNGSDTPGFLCARYSGSEKSENQNLALSRGTVWDEPQPGLVKAAGQKVLTDGENDYSLLEVRKIEFEHPDIERPL
ncbi:type VI secretion system accessory protein TagJ [Haloferula sp. BvORR071]|uniref:type VI secretion system accessory protein TagJ n=1 Tax=Haloferula sp. BvORR071 TaxID=1396141 RepID=UPI0005587350|nr:type VI secretion system accessory protein TagJ [Haloferula sp. BvORR071]